jgi:hypothetical protein
MCGDTMELAYQESRPAADEGEPKPASKCFDHGLQPFSTKDGLSAQMAQA